MLFILNIGNNNYLIDYIYVTISINYSLQKKSFVNQETCPLHFTFKTNCKIFHVCPVYVCR